MPPFVRRSHSQPHPAPGMPDSGRFRDQLVKLFWGWLIVLVVLGGLAGLVVGLGVAWTG